MKFAAAAIVPFAACRLAFAAAADAAPAGVPVAPPSFAVAEGDEGFSRYRPILDRMPFGSLPEGFDPNAPTGADAERIAEEEKRQADQIAELMKHARLSAFNVRDGKAFIGLSVQQDKASRAVYLEEGEERDGWKFVSADIPQCKAVVSKGGVEAEFSLGGGAPSPVAAGAVAAGQTAAADGEAEGEDGPVNPRALRAGRGRRNGRFGPDGRPESHSARLRARRAEEARARAERAESERRAEEERRSKERQLDDGLRRMEELKAGLEAAIEREEEDRLRREREEGGDDGAGNAEVPL